MRAEPVIHELDPSETDHVQWVLYVAATWRAEEPPPFEAVLAHPDLELYHVGWGRSGDAGVVAEVDGEFAGGAIYRLHTEEVHGYGFVDKATPEMGIAVAEPHRRRGVGRALMIGLADLARANGLQALSLSVNTDNPARFLYRAVGYREVRRGDDDIVMVLEL